MNRTTFQAAPGFFVPPGSFLLGGDGGGQNLLGNGQTTQPAPPGGPDNGGQGVVLPMPQGPGVNSYNPPTAAPPASGGTSYTPILLGAGGVVLALLYLGRNERKKRR